MGGNQSIEVPGGGSEGYHVLRVQDNSPGSDAGLEAFFDFIVAIGNTRLNQDNDTLKDLLKANVEKPIKMTVFSSKTQLIRDLMITPSLSWGGQGLLGVSIRFCSFEGASENIWHVLEVQPSSPAAAAGLRSDVDYIIGADTVLNESEDLFTLIESHEGKALKLYVYNLDDDRCREVTLTPNGAWGGEGSLGCGIGYGYLHRIPSDVLEEKAKARAAAAPVTQHSAPPAPSVVQAPASASKPIADGFSDVPLDVSENSTSHSSSAPPADINGLELSASLVSTATTTMPTIPPSRYTPPASYPGLTSSDALLSSSGPSSSQSAIVSSVIPGEPTPLAAQPKVAVSLTSTMPDISSLNISSTSSAGEPASTPMPALPPFNSDVLSSLNLPPLDLSKLPSFDTNLLKNSQPGALPADLSSLPPLPQMPTLNLGTAPAMTTAPPTTTS
ncbi:Golgi reassembly-stacking protein 2-like [Watersipora subatra]|uniref:Golgi reassembly-stacking protein 2-like n=1 Tax=Watersipora subatra TaxID=2589382 RepID=UPI00355BD6C6